MEKNGKKVRYAQVGVGGRARMYYEALCSTYTDSCELVGFCDQSLRKMNYANRMMRKFVIMSQFLLTIIWILRQWFRQKSQM